mmetsp:Transcript_112717/g.230692  ORF Transcript_112717/g.230692 Transcript_112717/m.230692 type:complete len:317 (+) Transcript_112717:307-1257(+)
MCNDMEWCGVFDRVLQLLPSTTRSSSTKCLCGFVLLCFSTQCPIARIWSDRYGATRANRRMRRDSILLYCAAAAAAASLASRKARKSSSDGASEVTTEYPTTARVAKAETNKIAAVTSAPFPRTLRPRESAGESSIPMTIESVPVPKDSPTLTRLVNSTVAHKNGKTPATKTMKSVFERRSSVVVPGIALRDVLVVVVVVLLLVLVVVLQLPREGNERGRGASPETDLIFEVCRAGKGETMVLVCMPKAAVPWGRITARRTTKAIAKPRVTAAATETKPFRVVIWDGSIVVVLVVVELGGDNRSAYGEMQHIDLHL